MKFLPLETNKFTILLLNLGTISQESTFTDHIPIIYDALPVWPHLSNTANSAS